MGNRHYIASGPKGNTVCSTYDVAVRTLAEDYKLTRSQRHLLRTWSTVQHGGDLLIVEGCTCDEPTRHSEGKA